MPGCAKSQLSLPLTKGTVGLQLWRYQAVLGRKAVVEPCFLITVSLFSALKYKNKWKVDVGGGYWTTQLWYKHRIRVISVEPHKQNTVGIIFYHVLSVEAKMKLRNTASWFPDISVV